MSRVHEDEKGLYVICNGSHYRPEVCEYARFQVWRKNIKNAQLQLINDRWPTVVKKGDWVITHHIPGSVLARIKVGSEVEIWTAHEPSNEMKRILVEQKLDKL